MASKLRSREILAIIGLACLLTAGLVLFSPLDNIAKILLLVFGLIFFLSFIDYRFGFFLFLSLRPIIDLTTNEQLFSIGGLNINLLFVYGGLMLAFSLFALVSNFSTWKENKLIWPWLLFILWAVISLTYSFDISSSIKELSRYLSIFVSFILGVSLIKNSKDLTLMIRAIVFSALIPALVALGQLFQGTGLIENGVNRLYGTMTHPNMLAYFLLFPITLSIFLFLNIKKNRVEAYSYLIIAIFLTFILIFTYARGAYIALFFIFIFIGLFKYRKFLLIGGISLFLLYLISLSFQERLNTIFQVDPYGSIAWRLNLYQDSLSYIEEKPIIGQGVGLAEAVITKNRDFRLGADQPHNDFIRLALDGGIINVAIYLFLIGILFLNLIKFYRTEKRPRLKMLNVFILAFAISLYTMSFGDNILNDTALQWQFWALIGGLMALQKIKKPAVLLPQV
jgi:O-antigen ligase